MAASFDPSGFFEFDLARGAVSSRGGDRVLLLSDTAVAPLVAAAVEGGDLTALRKLGRHLGETAARPMQDAVNDGAAEEVLTHVAAVLSLFGWGRLDVQRWGDAVVATLTDLPWLDDKHLGIAALLGGLFSALADEEVACVPVGEGGAFLLVAPSVAQQVWRWSRAGDDVAAIVGRLGPEESA